MNIGDLIVYTVAYFGLFTSIFFILTLIENKISVRHKKPTKYLEVTIIVPAFNEESNIEMTLNSLLNLDYPKDKLTIIIVDDGSTDNTYEIANMFESRNCKIFRKKNEGKASALNFALRRCTTEFVGALDADSYVKKDALKKIIGYFELSPKIMAVTPSLKVHKPKNFLQKIQRIEYLIGVFLRKIFAMLGSIHVTPGPFTIYRKSFFDKYGHYDENNLTEDIEVALRIQKHNYYIENSVDAEVFTISPSKFAPLYRQRLRWYIGFFENTWKYKELFSRKYGNLGLFILPASFFSVFLVIISLIYFGYRLIDNTIQYIINFYSIGFDFKTLLNFNIDFYLINTDSLMFLSLLSILVGIMIAYFAKYVSMEKPSIKSHYVIYAVTYWILFGFWWLAAIFYKATGRRVKWGSKKL